MLIYLTRTSQCVHCFWYGVIGWQNTEGKISCQIKSLHKATVKVCVPMYPAQESSHIRSRKGTQKEAHQAWHRVLGAYAMACSWLKLPPTLRLTLKLHKATR